MKMAGGNFIQSKSGNVAVLAAVAGTLIIGTAGVAVDYARYTGYKERLQSVADTAAIAGLRVYLANSLTKKKGQDTAKAAAVTTVNNFISTHISGLNGNPVVNITDSPAAVEIKATGTEISMLSKVWGNSQQTISALSKAEASKKTDVACVIALDTSASPGINFKMSGSMTAGDCSVWSNSPQAVSLSGSGSGNATASRFCASGGVSVGSTSFSTPPESGCPAVTDPFANLSMPAVGSCTYTNFSSSDPSVILMPGVYCGGIKLTSQADVTLSPGNYFIKDGSFTIIGGSNVQGSGVTFFLSGTNSGLKFAGAATLHLAAPTSGTYAGIAIFSDRASPVDTSTLSGSSSLDIEGVIYLPNHDVLFSGSNSTVAPAAYTVLIGRTITFSGSSNISIHSDFTNATVPVPTAIVNSRFSVLRTK